MRFSNSKTLNDFLDDKAFYKNSDCFCLGNTLAEAGVVVKKIVKAYERRMKRAQGVKINVGVDNERTAKSG